MSWHSVTLFFYWLLTGFYITSGEPPPPTITAVPGRVINRGENVTIRCEATTYKLQFRLYHGTDYIGYLDAGGYRADFPIINATENDSGEYYCFYIELRNHPTQWSSPSDPLQIQVIDLKKPEISWDTDPEDRSKDRFTCFIPQPPKEYQLLRCFLYQNLTTPLTNKTFIANSFSCSFSIPVQDIPDLRCLYVVQVSDSSKRQIRSPLSDPVRPAEDLKKPEISWNTDPEDRSKARFLCFIPDPSENYQFIQCVLYNNMALLEEKNFNTTSFSCAFSVPARDLSEIRCSYIVQVSSTHQIRSPVSDPAQPDNNDNETPYNSVHMIIIAGSLTALIVVICMLVMAFIIIKKHRPSQKKTDSGLPPDDQTVNANEVTYCAINETIKGTNLDEKQNRQSSDDNIDSDGITYAILNKDVLKKNTLEKNHPADTSIYAQVHKRN